MNQTYPNKYDFIVMQAVPFNYLNEKVMNFIDFKLFKIQLIYMKNKFFIVLNISSLSLKTCYMSNNNLRHTFTHERTINIIINNHWVIIV